MSCGIFFCKHSISEMLLASPSTSQHSLLLISLCLNILPCFEPAFHFTGLGKGREQENCQHPKSLPIASHGASRPWTPRSVITVCLISGIRWTELDPSYPHASSLSMKHQQLAITPKSTKMVRNLSINFIWLVYRVLISLLSERSEKK